MFSIDLPMVDQLSRQILIVLLNTSLKGLLIIVWVYILVSCTKNISAKMHHFVWFLSLASFFILPLLSLLLPSIEIGIFQLQENPGKVYQTFASVISVDLSPAGNLQMVNSQVDRGINELTSDSPMFRWTFFLIAWLAGVLIAFSRSYYGHVKARKIVKNSEIVQLSKIVSLFRNIHVDNDVNRSVMLYSNTEIGSPFTIGVFKPVIVIPADMATWPILDIKPLLLHEIHHINRKDYLTQTASMFICSVFWFVPVVWMALKKLHSEQEKSCDEEVIYNGINPRHYVNQMLKIVCSMAGTSIAPGLFMLHGRMKLFKKRIINIFDEQKKPMKKQNFILIGCVYLCVLSVIAGCVNGKDISVVENQEVLYGTWVNEKSITADIKWDVNSDGTLSIYDNLPNRNYTGTYEIAQKWTDENGNRFYKFAMNWSGSEITKYVLSKVSDNKSTLEFCFSNGDYPEEIDPDSIFSEYRIFYRQ